MESNLGNKQVMAENLKAYMDSRGINATKLSDDLDIPVTTISNWLRGVAYPRIDKIELLARYFNCSKSDLVEPFKDYIIEPEEGPFAGQRRNISSGCYYKSPVTVSSIGASSASGSSSYSSGCVGSCSPEASGASGGCSGGTSSCTGTASSSKAKEDTGGIIPMPKSIAPGETYVLDFEEAYIINKYRSLSPDNKMELFTAAYKINNDPDKE